MRGVGRFVLCVAVAALVAASCASEGPRELRVSVDPSVSRADQPVRIIVEGLRPDSEVTLQLSSQDAQLGKFASKATFVADGEGRVDVTSARAESGDYVGVDPMGLFVSMASATGIPRFYKWSLEPREFTIDAQQGESATAKTFTRRSSSEGALATEVRTNGIVGTYFLTADIG